MEAIKEALHEISSALRLITPVTLTPDHLQQAELTLKKFNVTELIRNFSGTNPPVIEDGKETDSARKQKERFADELNHHIDNVKDELGRIRQIRQTLNLERLDPLIDLTRKIIQPLYNLSASLEE